MARTLLALPLAALLAACGGSGTSSPDDPAPSGPSGRIAYSCGEPPRICLIDADGTGRARITGDAFHDDAADWSPDGNSLVVARFEHGRVRLYRIDVGTGAAERLTPRGENATYGRFSPDGTRLVFVCPDELDLLDICVSAADGSGIEVPNPTPAEELDPDWSPDGEQIAFARYFDDGVPEVYVMSANGSGERRLTEGLTPAWSPDGGTIVVSGGGLRLVDTETGKERALTEGQFDTEPSWSPDGRWLVFRRGELPDASLYVIGVDGEGERRLTFDGETAGMPSWAP